jgi:hypothetical protein
MEHNGDEWAVVTELDERGRLIRLEIRPVEVERTVDGKREVAEIPVQGIGITARLFRSLPLGAFVDAAKEAAGRWPGKRDVVSTRTPRGNYRVTPAKPFRERPGRAGRPDVEYALLARRYLELVATSRTPVADLADERGESRQTVANALHEARSDKRNLLTRPPGRMAGGELTTNAIRILEEAEGGDS